MTRCATILRGAGLGALLLLAWPANAAEWAEIPYDPPVGSRWMVRAVSHSQQNRAPDTTVTSIIRSKADMTIDGKADDGFRITYVTRELSIDGNAPSVPVMRPVFATFRGVVIRARTDRTGKPVAIENLDEVRAAMRKLVDRATAPFADKPEVAAVLRRILEGMFIVDGARAAEIYLQELPQVALGQSTGLKPGEERRTSEEKPSPIGGPPSTTTSTLRIASADPTTGTVRYERDLEIDPGGAKAFAAELTRQIVTAAGAGNNAAALERATRGAEVSLENRSVIEVVGGITRSVTATSKRMITIAGRTVGSRNERTATVTAVAPKASRRR